MIEVEFIKIKIDKDDVDTMLALATDRNNLTDEERDRVRKALRRIEDLLRRRR